MAIRTLKNTGALDAADVGYDLILLWGQSNMSGAADFDVARYDLPMERISQYGAAGIYANMISAAVEPLAMHDTATGQTGTSGGMGPGSVFARWYLQSVPNNRRVLLVPSAHGGTALCVNTTPLGWRRGVSGNLYAQGVALAQAALAAAGPNSRIVAALWVQGETDGGLAVDTATYQTDLDALISGLRTDLGIPDLPFIIGQMVPEYLGNGTEQLINLAHLGESARLPRVRVGAGVYAANKTDHLHYTGAGQRILGRNLFNAYRRAITGVADPTPPAVPGQVTGLVATPGVTQVALSWTAVSGVGSYYLEYQPTGSGPGWADVVSTFNTSATQTGLTTGTSYSFRCRAVTTGGPGLVSSTVTATPT